MSGCDVVKTEIVRKRSEDWNAFSDQDGNAGKGEVLNETCSEEALHGDTAVDIKMLGSAGGESSDDLEGWAGHLFDRFLGDAGRVERLRGVLLRMTTRFVP